MTLLIVDPWQYCVCFIRSGAARYTLLMVLFLDRMCQCGLHAVLWSDIGSLMRFLAAEPRSTTGPLFPSQCSSGTILLAMCSMVWDWRVSKAGLILFYWPKRSIPTIVFYYFPLSLFFSIGWYCGVGIFGLIGCISLSLSLELWTFLVIIIIKINSQLSPFAYSTKLTHQSTQRFIRVSHWCCIICK